MAISSKVSRILVAVLAIAMIAIVGQTTEATIIRFVTTKGNIDFRLYDQAAPLHVANILQYINSNRYDGTFIHRSAKTNTGQPFVIQGGGYKILSSILAPPSGSGWTRIPSFGTVTNEFKLSNLRGTLALAKGAEVSSGSSEWFINLNNGNSFLDQPPPTSNSFTVFGRVIGNGMTVADSIASLDRINAGGAFNEVPVLNLDKVLAQQDVKNDDVVQLIDSVVLNYKAGDYDFNGVVNAADYTVLRSSYGSITNAAADGNGDGVVDARDYVVWRNTLGQTGGPGSGAGVPEPSASFLAISGGLMLLAKRRRRVAVSGLLRRN
jgi:peptidyl-prolyl cis-trans isomerase A (cyclophilin A)